MDRDMRHVRLIAAGAVVFLALASNGSWAGLSGAPQVRAEGLAQLPPTATAPSFPSGGASVPGAGAGQVPGTGQTAGTGQAPITNQAPNTGQVPGTGGLARARD